MPKVVVTSVPNGMFLSETTRRINKQLRQIIIITQDAVDVKARWKAVIICTKCQESTAVFLHFSFHCISDARHAF